MENSTISNIDNNDVSNDLDSSETLKWIGLTVVIVSALLSNLGVNIQKLSHDQEELRSEWTQREYYTRPMWLVGMVLIFLASFGDFEALGFAPQALVASVGGGCTVLANVFFAHLWLKQSLTWNDCIGTLCIVSGIILSSITNEPDDELTLHDLENQFMQPGFIIYMGSVITLLLGILGEIQSVQKDRDILRTRVDRLPYLLATAAGIFGSFSVLLAKCASELLLLTLQGDNQFQYVTTYLFLGGMVATLILQTDFLNRAIMHGDTLTVFPVFQCFWIGCSVISGIVFYQKYFHFSALDWIALPLALIFIIVGIYFLSKHKHTSGTPGNTPGRKRIMSPRGSVNYGSFCPASPASNHSYISTVCEEGLMSLE